MKEQWRPIEGYYGIYEVSDNGRVRSAHRTGQGSVKWRVMKPMVTITDYRQVHLLLAGTAKAFRVHRLVATAFIPNPSCLPVVHHVDGNTANNVVGNLAWCTHKENIRIAHADRRERGVISHNAKPVTAFKGGCFVGWWPSGQHAAKALGIHEDSVRKAALSGRKCNGYTITRPMEVAV